MNENTCVKPTTCPLGHADGPDEASGSTCLLIDLFGEMPDLDPAKAQLQRVKEGSRQLHIEEFERESMGPSFANCTRWELPGTCWEMIDALASPLASRLTPQGFARDAPSKEDHHLKCIANSAQAFLNDLPAFNVAVADLTQRSVVGVACDLSVNLHHKAHAGGFVNERDFLSAARVLTKALALIQKVGHASEAGICYTNRATWLLQLGRHARASEDCAAALKLNGCNGKAHSCVP